MKSNYINILIKLILIFFTFGSSVAQSTIKGKIIDENGHPIFGAAIYVKNISQQFELNGSEFEFAYSGTFPITLEVKFDGYVTSKIKLMDAQYQIISLKKEILLEEYVVTAGDIGQTPATSPVAIDNFRIDDLKATGQYTLDKMLHYLAPSFNSTNQAISDATAHFDPADLRGLGPSRTLVLINGKRKNVSALVYINDTPGKGDVGVDMKSIPIASIKRIEVLRDGASVKYGSDAIAGVIHIFLKDGTNVNESEVNAYSGITSEGDGRTIGYNFAKNFRIADKGYINISNSFNYQQATNRSGKPGSDSLFGIYANDKKWGNWIKEHPDLGVKIGQPEMTNLDIFFNAKYDISSDVSFYGFGGSVFRNGKTFALYRTPYWVADPNFIYHNASQSYQGFLPTFESNIIDNSLCLGFKGNILNDWEYDISSTFGRNKVVYSVKNSLNKDMGRLSPTNFHSGGYEFKHNIINLNLDKKIKNLLKISIGTEYRAENFITTVGDEASYYGQGTESFPGIEPQNAVDATRYNIGIYSDLTLDSDKSPFLKRFLFGIGGRFENYSDFGTTWTGKINSRFKILDDDKFIIRGSASTGFRAPALHQIYLSNIQTLVTDGKVGDQATFNNESPILRFLQVPKLKEETSLNFTAGFTSTPIKGKPLFISVDYYNIKVDNRIVYSSSINAKSIKSFVGNALEIDNILSVKFFTNAINTETNGLDFVMNYMNIPFLSGALNINLAGNFTETVIKGQIQTPKPLLDVKANIFDRQEQSRVTSARPESKILMGLSYTANKFECGISNSLFGKVTWAHETDPTKDQTFKPKLLTDVSLGYKINETIKIKINVNNILNVYPDLIDAKGDTVTNLGGRFKYPWEVNQFGFNGTLLMLNLNVRF